MRNIMGNTMRMRNRRQRGISVVELLVALSIFALITPALALAVVQMVRTPASASASLMTSDDASKATEAITCDAGNADTWAPEPNPVANPNNYGTFVWTDADGKVHVVLYKYDNGSLVRQETVAGVAGAAIVIARGLGSMGDLTISQGTQDYVTVDMKVAQKDADSTPVAAKRTFVAWLRLGAANMDKWGYRREIVINYAGEKRLTNYPMLLNLTGAPLNWNIQSEIAANRMLGNGADIRFVRLAGVYQLPISIVGATTLANYALRVVIDSKDGIGDDAADQVVLNHMAPNYTGSDIRFFSQGVTNDTWIYDPSADTTGATALTVLPFWIQERSDTRLIAWVKIPTVGTTGLYMYYGDPMKTSASSLANTFTAATFTDPFTDASLIDASQSSHYVISSGQVRINLSSTALKTPSFEVNNADWTKTSTFPAGNGADGKPSYTISTYDTGWYSDGTHSAKLFGSEWDDDDPQSATELMYVDISQSASLTNVSSISFGANLFATVGMVYKAQMLVDSTVVWSIDLPQVATSIYPTVDVSSYTGTHTLRFRIIVVKYDSWNASFTCYFDNVKTTQYAKVTSVAFPSGALARFAGGNQLSWVNTTTSGTTSILYRLQGYDGAAWENIPDSLLPGNTAGLSASPVSFADITLASRYQGYQAMRLVAYLYTVNDAVTPTIDSWTATYYYRQCVSTAQGSTQFTDSFNDSTRIDSSQSTHITVSNGQVQIAGVVTDPSFELNSDSWVSGTSDVVYLHSSGFSNDTATGWPTNGTHSAKLWSANYDPNTGECAEVSQFVDLTYVTNIYFDARLYVSGTGTYTAQALLDNTVLWSQALPTTATIYLNQSIAVTHPLYDGTHTLRFRVYVTASPSGNRTFTAYFDKVGVNTWATVTSAAFPGTTGSFVSGTRMYWTQTVPTNTQIKYQLQGFNGTAWVLIPDGILSGNSTGFQTCVAPAVNISAVTAAGGYQQLRLVATLSNSNDILYSSPAIQDWTATFVVNNVAVDRATSYVPAQERYRYAARYDMLRFFLNPNDQVDGTNPNDGVWNPAGNNVKLWVVLSDIPVGRSSIYVYYGNANAGNAGFPAGHPGTLRDAIGERFLDTFNDWSMIDTSASQHVTVNSGQVQVASGANLIQNSSFENSTATPWLLYNDDDDLQPSIQNVSWTMKDGSNVLRLRTYAVGGMIVYDGNFVEARQTIDTTNIHTISFNCGLVQDVSNCYIAQVLLDETVVWTRNLPTGSMQSYRGSGTGTKDAYQTIDMHNFPAVSTGTHTLKCRVTCNCYAATGSYDTTNDFDSYWDWFLTTGYSAYDDIHLVSVSIPLAGALKTVSQGFTIGWTDSCSTQQDVIYQLQYTNNLVTPNWQSIATSYFTCGNNNLWTGETGGGETLPAELINTGQAWDANYIYLRLWCKMRVNDLSTPASWPKISDWALLSGQQLSSSAPTVYGWGLIKGDYLGTGDGSQTNFLLTNRPVVAGSQTIYLGGVSQSAGYTLDLATGLITFAIAPGTGVDVTADYLCSNGETRYDALPLSVYGEVPTPAPDGVQTQFTLAHSPVVQGSETIYLGGVPTAWLGVSYALVLVNGGTATAIQFQGSYVPPTGQVITADYLYKYKKT